VTTLFVRQADDVVAFVFTAAAAFYFLARVAIVRHIGYRRIVDQKTLLETLAAYVSSGWPRLRLACDLTRRLWFGV
jgi:hypothetical protein